MLICVCVNPSGSARGTRITNKTDSQSSIYPPLTPTSSAGGWGMIRARWRSYIHIQECLPDNEPLLPRLLCFSEPKYFPSGREKQRWLTVWSESHQLLCWQSGDVCTLADVRPSDSWLTAEDWEIGKMKDAWSVWHALFMQRSKHLVATLTHWRSRHTVPAGQGKRTLAPCWGLQPFFHTLQGAESCVFLKEKVGLGYYIYICKTFLQITFVLSTKEYSRWGLLNPY